MTRRVLIGSPVRQTSAVLAAFLEALPALAGPGIDVHYVFIDDNVDPEASAQLARFAQEQAHVTIEAQRADDTYRCDDATHHWNLGLMRKVAGFKDRIIRAALEGGYDFLFLIDSDVVVPPQLLAHLASLDKPVVSEVFWTRWQPDAPSLPQVWLSDAYTLHEHEPEERLERDERVRRTGEFLRKLRRPGVYPVGGLGACTLIRRDALARGLRFAEIDNVKCLVGEDRHFCVRARALGVELWADTRYPPLHLYRAPDLERLPIWRARTAADFLTRPKVTLSMVVKNEADRYLRQVLRAHRPFIDEVVVIDDGSTDGTVDVVRRELEGIPLHLVVNAQSRFANEVDLRKQQWDAAVATNPDWLLVLDADELFEDRAADVLPEIVRGTDYRAVGFRLYDFWDATHYRSDENWNAHETHRPFLVRYTPDFDYRWREAAQHCGRTPFNVLDLPSATSDLRIKHLGWADVVDRALKAARYEALDQLGAWGHPAQYQSILDPAPNLVAWEE